MMNIWHDIAPERIKSDDFVACIEISKGGKNKYEMDKETGMLKLDRVLFTSPHYPAKCTVFAERVSGRMCGGLSFAGNPPFFAG